jgi:hypothetical protein
MSKTFSRQGTRLLYSGETADDIEGQDRFPIRTFFRNRFNVTTSKSPVAAVEEVLDGSLVGDLGFDPVGFAKNKDELFLLREAEIKHGRIAMLAALGWPSSELYHYTFSSVFGLPDLIADVSGLHTQQTRLPFLGPDPIYLLYGYLPTVDLSGFH